MTMLIGLIAGFALMALVVAILLVKIAIDRIDLATYLLGQATESDEDKRRRLKVEAEDFDTFTGEYGYP